MNINVRITQMFIKLKASYKLIPIKTPMTFFSNLDQNANIHMGVQEILAEAILKNLIEAS